MRRAALLVSSLAALSGCGVILGPDAPRDHAALFDQFWAEFDRHYAFFELKRVDWAGVRDVYRPQAIAATTDGAFADVLGRMIDTLDDVHVSLFTPGRTYQSGDSATSVHTYYDESTTRSYVPQWRSTPSRQMRYGLVAPRVGWLRVPQFAGTGWGDETDIVLRELGALDGLIIDVRNNGGGSDTNGRDIAARFTDKRRGYAYVKYRNGPAHSDFSRTWRNEIAPAGTHFGGVVVVLLNARCFSATEHFALMMRAIPGVVLMGDSTGGASGNPLQRELSNGWTYRLSESIAYDLDMKMFEEVGIAPDVIVRPTLGDSLARRDVELERAIAYINTRASSP